MIDVQTKLSSPSSITTIQQHILQEQQRFAGATGEFSWLLSGITLAAKAIHAKVARAGLNDILGEYGQENVQGESQQKLDVYANDVMLHSNVSRTGKMLRLKRKRRCKHVSKKRKKQRKNALKIGKKLLLSVLKNERKTWKTRLKIGKRN